MGLLIDKKETKTNFEYRIKKKNWITGWLSILLIFFIGIAEVVYRIQNAWLFFIGIIIMFAWIAFVAVSVFPLWLAMQPFSKKIVTKDTKEGIGLNVVWKVKK